MGRIGLETYGYGAAGFHMLLILVLHIIDPETLFLSCKYCLETLRLDRWDQMLNSTCIWDRLGY
jgi:hypothetical protein